MTVSLIGAVFVILLLTAAVSDILRYRIPNAIVLALVVLFLLSALLRRHDVDWLDHLGAGAACLVIGYALFRRNYIGAGDVKLVAAIALYAGFAQLIALLVLVSLAGLAVMLLILAARQVGAWLAASVWIDDEMQWPRILVRGEGIPYGAGIALGALAAMSRFPAWLWSF